jgi:hypothetical protein
VIQPTGTAVPVFTYPGVDGSAGISYSGENRMVYLCFDLAGVQGAAERQVLLERILRFLDIDVPAKLNLLVTGYSLTELEGDGDGLVSPGEKGLLGLSIHNPSLFDAHSLQVEGIPLDGTISIPDGTYVIGYLGAGESGTARFNLQLGSDVQDPSAPQIALRITAENYIRADTLGVNTGSLRGFSDDFEGPDKGWIHYAPDRAFLDNWGLTSDGDNTYMHCQGPLSKEQLDAALVTPVIGIGRNSILSLSQQVSGNANDSEAYGGSVVEILHHGYWQQLFPEDGYNAKASYYHNHFTMGVRCFSGVPSGEWEEQVFDLAQYEGYVKLRFHITGGSSLPAPARWSIDNIVVTAGEGQVTSVEEAATDPLRFYLEPNYPNPFNGSTAIRYCIPETSDVNLVVYNTLGQAVKTLAHQQLPPGTYNVVFDGLDSRGTELASGMYLLMLNTERLTSVQKMILLK